MSLVNALFSVTKVCSSSIGFAHSIAPGSVKALAIIGLNWRGKNSLFWFR